MASAGIQSFHLQTEAQCLHGGKKLEIISKLDDGETCISWARFYKVCITTITDIKKNREGLVCHFIIKKFFCILNIKKKSSDYNR